MQYRRITLSLLVIFCASASAQSPTPPTGDEFTIAWTGDPHHSTVGGSLDKIAAWLTNNAAAWHVQAFVSVGDNVCRSQADQTATDPCFISVGGYTPLTHFAATLDGLGIHYVIINGNHDCQGFPGSHTVWDTIHLQRTGWNWDSVFPNGTFRNQFLKVDYGKVHLGILGITSDDTPNDSDCETPDLTTAYKIASIGWSAGTATITLPRLSGILPGDTISVTGGGNYNASSVVVSSTTLTTVQYPLARNPGGACVSNCGAVTTSGTAVRRWAQHIIDTNSDRQFMTVMHQTPIGQDQWPSVSGTAAGPFSIKKGSNDTLSLAVGYSITKLAWAGGTATVSTMGSQQIQVGEAVTVSAPGNPGYTVTNAIVTASTTTSISYAAANPGSACSSNCGTARSAPVLITLTPGTRTASQVVSEISTAMGVHAWVNVHPLTGGVRISQTALNSGSTVNSIILNTVGNSAYSTLGFTAGQASIVDRVTRLASSVEGPTYAYTPCQVQIPDCSRDGVGMWNGFIAPNPRILWTLNGHDQTQPAIYRQNNNQGRAVTMAMGGECAIFLIKFQPALHQVTWYLVDMAANKGAGALSTSPYWYYSPDNVATSVAVFPWEPSSRRVAVPPVGAVR
jgi:hypothetical protein